MTTTSCIALALAIGVLVLGCTQDTTTPGTDTVKPNFAASAATQRQVFPVNQAFLVPCANGGAGEVVALTGEQTFLFHTTIDGTGALHSTTDIDTRLFGTGLTTGAKYRGISEDNISDSFGGANTSSNTVNQRMIGQGSASNFMFHVNVAFTINANGEPTASVVHTWTDCR
jgi:hypothetical protein